jgi:quercetin dioxygenase-like cupin family protein
MIAYLALNQDSTDEGHAPPVAVVICIARLLWTTTKEGHIPMFGITKTVTNMEIKRIGSQPSGKGPDDWFSGTVRIDPLFQASDPARAGGACVTFEPGARTAWHTHPLGQTLIVTSGCGWAQREGGRVEEIHPGDVIWFSPGEKHWHGATQTTAMTHIAIQEQLNGKAVEWMEKVTEEQYRLIFTSNESGNN